MPVTSPERHPLSDRIARGALVFGAGIGLVLGLVLTGMGLWLISLGGSWYYTLAGVGTLAASVALMRGREPRGIAILSGVVFITVLWSIWEIDGKGWMPSWGFDLAGRVGLLLGLLIFVTIAATVRARHVPDSSASSARVLWSAVLAPVMTLAAGIVIGAQHQEPRVRTASSPATPLPQPGAPAGAGRAAWQRDAGEWTAYGGSNLGQRFSPAAQITRDNVSQLAVAWSFATGDLPANDRVFYAFQNTPVKIDDTLYVCANSNQVFALDAGTGERRWHFDPQVSAEAMEPLFSVACRAVAYYEDITAPAAECPRRILLATQDSRLIALDAETGQACTGFGENGTVDLAEGMANQAVGLSSTTSGPTVVGDRVVVGQQVSDNQRQDAPSGVVRAYDVRTGDFAWAWDARRVESPQTPLAAGEVWPQGTPNVWAVISADESLGLVYLPTGNAANDHFGGHRTPEDDEYTDAVIAVDAETGERRWHFRTVDHDLWDYDLGAQPVVMDMDIDGAMRRVVLVGTKTGSIFVLDAATGEPLRPIERRAAPQGAVEGDWTAPTQPQSVFYPNFAGAPGADPERIDARHAFGLTPVDALMCRVQFHRMRYEGMYTPPTDQGLGMLLFPGTIGGLNWGGLSVNPEQQILVTNHSRLPNRVQLYPRSEVQDQAIGDGGKRPDQEIAPQAGAPFGVDRPMWLSPLGVPCISPPWGYLAATDLRTGDLLWSQPLGTGYDIGPLGIPTRVKLTIGTPNIGGPVSTRSGLTFIAAAQDNFLRAFDTHTGELLWEHRLPYAAQSGPMTYEHEGRQYVAVAAGGHARLETEVGDRLMVFALPQ
ncbi:membrane-bound PQQ-dependent dehydrogenase, glucose/quinate/shikimate family [Achromobacter sp. GG226]|uniref:membrane-bound PQQ-dependent dehydrogenase, glucose/quinate/shikimate family n=1 Tax=Verticiella alkaliphila TaxID=2779529 RepID=UPI001C0AFA86|nr:membrane-bound PQQ-dependent dehydrogenase, glucose/quinate/shikimate family [Verticiella sp. GG226]MBU4611730.1 membrane-bound PQQ-dependent dehydrogenase, glucose/quinate/shikimate family [Verticiella sp. GG226]